MVNAGFVTRVPVTPGRGGRGLCLFGWEAVEVADH